MLEYDRIEVSEGINVNKTNGSSVCIICDYWYFLNIRFKFQPEVCNGSHNLMKEAMNVNDFAILFVKRNDSRIYYWCMSKDEAINIWRNGDLTEKAKLYKT